jgi:hypothetical protein
MRTVVTSLLALYALGTFAAEIPKAPIPPSPYLPIIYKFADAMLEHGRDTHGPQKTGLFLSALDRVTFSPLTNRALAVANPQEDENLLRLLYTLSELSGKPKYRDAADTELRWYFENVASATNALVPWGITWEVMRDEAVPAKGFGGMVVDESRPWVLWDRCFAVAPQASARIAHRLIAYQQGDLPRHAGFYIRTWATAYAHTGDKELLKAIETVLNHFEKIRSPTNDFVAAGALRGSIAPLLSMAIDCDAAARLVPPPLAQRLENFAADEDETFCKVRHDVKRTAGFVASANYLTRVVREGRTLPWKGPQGVTTAQVGMMCVSRYENSGDVGYRDLIHAAADVYLTAPPDKEADVSPRTLGHAISLQVAAWRSTARQEYLDRARALADFAVKNFFDQGPLPRASLRSNDYEAITGAGTLALGLVELHLHILAITAVRYPPNTIDR